MKNQEKQRETFLVLKARVIHGDLPKDMCPVIVYPKITSTIAKFHNQVIKEYEFIILEQTKEGVVYPLVIRRDLIISIEAKTVTCNPDSFFN